MITDFFLSPVAGSNVSDPLWGPIWFSLCFISHPRRSFLISFFELVIVLFWPLIFFNVTDGGCWWMVDGGAWVPKRCSDFAQNFVRWSSQHINLLYFGKSAKNFFCRKKIRLQVSKLGKKIKNPIGSRHFFSAKTGSLIFMKIYRNEV